MLNVRDYAHWVVADGRRATWISADEARGTYTIADPLYPATTLYTGHDNRFTYALRTRRVTTLASAAGTSGQPGLAIVADGPSYLFVVGPQGLRIEYDPASGSYTSTFGQAIALHGLRSLNTGGGSGAAAPRDVVVIANAPVGAYTVRVIAEENGRRGLTAATFAHVGAEALDGASATLNAGEIGTFSLAYAPSSVSLAYQGLTAVEEPDSRVDRGVRIVPNPLRLAGHVTWEARTACRSSVRLLDVSGRLVRTLWQGEMVPGKRSVALATGSSGGGRLAAGLYFVEVVVDGSRRVGRVVVLGD